jgi:kynureninase
MLEKGKDIYNGLMKYEFFTDWREPNVIRLAPVPLYNSFEEVWMFAERLKKLIG